MISNKEDNSNPVQKLLKSLANAELANSINSSNTPLPPALAAAAAGGHSRVLTSVLFGEKNPIIVVGDNRGVVNIYRVFDPITITNMGPLQQFMKLKETIIRQTDPSHLHVLETDHGGY